MLETATALGADRFDLVGWSLGALIGITIAGVAAERMRTLTLIDHCNREEPAAYTAVRQGLNRLDAVVDQPEDYLAAIRAAGLVTPWNSYWEQFYVYELGVSAIITWSRSLVPCRKAAISTSDTRVALGLS